MDASALASAEYWLSWIATAKLVAAFLVAIGVAMEFGSEWISGPFEATVKHAREVQVTALESAAETARGEIAEATKAAATANERAADANERAGKLETEAAAANERAAAIMRATAWRQFTPDQTRKLKDFLSNHSGKYVAAWIANDPESLYLAIDFVNLLASIPGKWDMVNSAKVYPANLVYGISIPDVAGAEPIVKVFRDAFTAAGIAFSTDALPTESMSYGPPDTSVFAGRAIVLFGSRKPSFSQPLQ